MMLRKNIVNPAKYIIPATDRNHSQTGSLLLSLTSEKLRYEYTGAETNENIMAKFIIAATFPAKKNTITIATATVTIIHILKCEVLTSFCFIINLRHSALARE